jgi:hypothetical protein
LPKESFILPSENWAWDSDWTFEETTLDVIFLILFIILFILIILRAGSMRLIFQLIIQKNILQVLLLGEENG